MPKYKISKIQCNIFTEYTEYINRISDYMQREINTVLVDKNVIYFLVCENLNGFHLVISATKSRARQVPSIRMTRMRSRQHWKE